MATVNVVIAAADNQRLQCVRRAPRCAGRTLELRECGALHNKKNGQNIIPGRFNMCVDDLEGCPAMLPVLAFRLGGPFLSGGRQYQGGIAAYKQGVRHPQFLTSQMVLQVPADPT